MLALGCAQLVRIALPSAGTAVAIHEVAVGGQETALFVTLGERAAKWTGWGNLTRTKVLPVAFAPPFGISLLDIPPRLPLPAKITVEVLPPIDLAERFGPDPDHKGVYDGDHRRDAGRAVRPSGGARIADRRLRREVSFRTLCLA